MIQLMLDNGYQLTLHDMERLPDIAAHFNQGPVIDLLETRGVPAAYIGRARLSLAMEYGSVIDVERCLRRTPPSSDDINRLLHAALREHKKAKAMLLARQIRTGDEWIVDCRAHSPLRMVAKYGGCEILSMLFEQKVVQPAQTAFLFEDDPEDRNADEMPAIAVYDLLLGHHNVVLTKQRALNTALRECLLHNRPILVERLLQQGADSRSIGADALVRAKRAGHSRAVQLIEEHRAARQATFDSHCDQKMNGKGDADGVGTHDADEGLSERALQPVSMIHSSLGADDHQAAPTESLSVASSRTLVAAGAAAVAVAVPVCSPDSGQTSDSQTRAGSGVNSDDNDTADDERVGVKRRRL